MLESIRMRVLPRALFLWLLVLEEVVWELYPGLFYMMLKGCTEVKQD